MTVYEAATEHIDDDGEEAIELPKMDELLWHRRR